MRREKIKGRKSRERETETGRKIGGKEETEGKEGRKESKEGESRERGKQTEGIILREKGKKSREREEQNGGKIGREERKKKGKEGEGKANCGKNAERKGEEK